MNYEMNCKGELGTFAWTNPISHLRYILGKGLNLLLWVSSDINVGRPTWALKQSSNNKLSLDHLKSYFLRIPFIHQLQPCWLSEQLQLIFLTQPCNAWEITQRKLYNYSYLSWIKERRRERRTLGTVHMKPREFHSSQKELEYTVKVNGVSQLIWLVARGYK